MKLHNMFKKTVGKEHGTSKNTKVRNVPEGLLKKCNKCGAAILAEDAVITIIFVRSVTDISGCMQDGGSR